jgi:aminomethyltransferase
VDLSGIKYYWFTDGDVAGTPARIAHTGYTGEDGFEIYVPPPDAERMWKLVMDAGAEFDIKPVRARCAQHPASGSQDGALRPRNRRSISPLEADLGWIVKLDKGEFVGRDALLKQKESGIRRKLVGFEMRARGIGRDGYEVFLNGAPPGWVTSGGPSPDAYQEHRIVLPSGGAVRSRNQHSNYDPQPARGCGDSGNPVL